MPNKTYPKLGSSHEIKRELAEMGIDIFEPESRSEEIVARAFDEFSHFVLHREKDACLEILENDLRRGGSSVGELQGGSDAYSIYRVSFPSSIDDCNGEFSGNAQRNSNAAIQLLDLFSQQKNRLNTSSLTIAKIEQYMLGMCDRRSRERNCANYTSLGNLMFIMQFGGPTDGQVRHIDNMVPNIQICCYMSSTCPSTTVYAMDDGDGLLVTDGSSLVEFWDRQKNRIATPELVRDVLLRKGDISLKSKWYTKYFASWKTINSQLLCFGKLYQPVAYQLGMDQTEPGTTLLAGGNEIHAGPATTESRMFAFAIGIPQEAEGAESHVEDVDEDDENDGEVQYSPVLLHIDFCCLLFSILDHEYKNPDIDGPVRDSKRFLVGVLMELIIDYPMKEYLLQIDEDRADIRTWLANILVRLEHGQSTSEIAEEAANSDRILYSPDVMKRRAKKKRSRSTVKKELN
ncbi:hypothetical protein ACHAWF_007172 [Thalassiosira exigua]